MRILLCCLLAVGAAAAADESPGRLHASAEPALLNVAPLLDDSTLIAPGELTFAFTIETACDSAAIPESLSISIADTHVVLGAAGIGATTTASLVLPAAQSAPFRIDGFCRGGESDTPGADAALIEGAYTARLSLRCTVADKPSIIFATLPVGVRLACNRPVPPDAVGDDDPGD